MIAIWGAAGTIGRSVAAALVRRNRLFRVVGRTAAKLDALGAAEIVQADVADPVGCARAAAGAEAIVYALGLAYTKKAFSTYPPMMRAAVAAARAAGVKRLLLISNVYSYGRPQTRPVSEDHPRQPVAVKGRYRKEQEDVLLAANGDGLETLVLRLPDFYGPAAEASLTHTIFSAYAEGKPAFALGPVDLPHEFIFTPDVGPVVSDLLAHAGGWGRAYNLAGPGTITFRELAERAAAALGCPPRLRAMGPGLVKLVGLVVPLMRELSEMSYLLTDPVILDDAALRKLLPDFKKTPYPEGIATTAEWYKRRKKQTGDRPPATGNGQ